MRRIAVLLVFGLAACQTSADATTSTSTLPPATTVEPETTTTAAPTTTLAATTTLSPEEIAQAELEADAALIADLHRGSSDSWFQGVENGYLYREAHNHPSMDCTVDDFRTYYAYSEGTEIEEIVLQDTIQRQDGWILPDTGEVPDGRIYVFTIELTLFEPGFDTRTARLEVHSVILNGKASFFWSCRDI